MKYKVIKYLKNGIIQDLDVTNLTAKELEDYEKQGVFLCPGEKCNARLCLVHSSKNGGKTCFLKAVDDKQHQQKCFYKIGNYKEIQINRRLDGIFTEKQVNDAVRRISKDYLNPEQTKTEKKDKNNKNKIISKYKEHSGSNAAEKPSGGKIVFGDSGDGTHGRMRRRYKVSSSDIGIMATICGVAKSIGFNEHKEMIVKFKDERLENIDVYIGAVYEHNNSTEFSNLYLAKEYFDKKTLIGDVWVAAGGLVNQLNGRLILEIQANGALRIDDQTIMKMAVENAKKTPK